MIVPRHYDVRVQLADGSVKKMNLFQMGVMADAVRFRADHGVWPPSVNRLGLTRSSVAERFAIDPHWARTYDQLADTLAECHESMMVEWKAAQR